MKLQIHAIGTFSSNNDFFLKIKRHDSTNIFNLEYIPIIPDKLCAKITSEKKKPTC